ncbi:hypothetical protein [Streptomyces sp. TR02-1]|uniref:hypothetical protein n=1 Tax=Streptomyces sp. TR02-1 TaxID=3385977 RepID=UPI0039A250FD
MQKLGRKWVTISAAGLALIGGGYASGVYIGPDSRFGEVMGSACRDLTQEANAEDVDALAPAAEGYAVHESIMEKPGYYSGLCTVEAEGDQALYLSVEFTGYRSFEAWSDEVVDGFVPAADRQRLDIAGGGWSTPTVTAVYLPCRMSDGADTKRGGLSVRAKANNEGDHRAELVAIAERAAEEAGSLSGPCDEPDAE